MSDCHDDKLNEIAELKKELEIKEQKICKLKQERDLYESWLIEEGILKTSINMKKETQKETDEFLKSLGSLMTQNKSKGLFKDYKCEDCNEFLSGYTHQDREQAVIEWICIKCRKVYSREVFIDDTK